MLVQNLVKQLELAVFARTNGLACMNAPSPETLLTTGTVRTIKLLRHDGHRSAIMFQSVLKHQFIRRQVCKQQGQCLIVRYLIVTFIDMISNTGKLILRAELNDNLVCRPEH